MIWTFFSFIFFLLFCCWKQNDMSVVVVSMTWHDACFCVYACEKGEVEVECLWPFIWCDIKFLARFYLFLPYDIDVSAIQYFEFLRLFWQIRLQILPPFKWVYISIVSCHYFITNLHAIRAYYSISIRNCSNNLACWPPFSVVSIVFD